METIKEHFIKTENDAREAFRHMSKEHKQQMFGKDFTEDNFVEFYKENILEPYIPYESGIKKAR